MAQSRFDTSLGGWKVAGDPAPGYPQWFASGSDGVARTVDGEGGKTMYWKAPAKFLGNKRAAFRGSLTYNLRQSSLDNQYEDDDVVLKGNGMRLVHDHSGSPATGGFSGYRLDLVPSSLTKESGGAPSGRQLKRVLGDLRRLMIRAEYRVGPDTDDIDAARLSKPAPAP